MRSIQKAMDDVFASVYVSVFWSGLRLNFATKAYAVVWDGVNDHHTHHVQVRHLVWSEVDELKLKRTT